MLGYDMFPHTGTSTVLDYGVSLGHNTHRLYINISFIHCILLSSLWIVWYSFEKKSMLLYTLRDLMTMLL